MEIPAFDSDSILGLGISRSACLAPRLVESELAANGLSALAGKPPVAHTSRDKLGSASVANGGRTGCELPQPVAPGLEESASLANGGTACGCAPQLNKRAQSARVITPGIFSSAIWRIKSCSKSGIVIFLMAEKALFSRAWLR